MNAASFQSLYCERRGVAPSDYRADLLRRTLYLHARPCRWFLTLLDRHHFQADYEFIEDVAHLVKPEAFHDALSSYAGHFSNHGFLRGRLRLRISARKMWLQVRTILPPGDTAKLDERMKGENSQTPFLPKQGGGSV